MKINIVRSKLYAFPTENVPLSVCDFVPLPTNCTIKFKTFTLYIPVK